MQKTAYDMRISYGSSDVCSSDLLERLGLVPAGTVLRQSDRDAHYREALERLLAGGDAFECHCSRSDLAGSGGVHRACVPGARRPDPAIRLRVPDGTVVGFDDRVHGTVEQDVSAQVGDFVLRRADGQIGRAHVGTPVTNAHLLCRLLLE